MSALSVLRLKLRFQRPSAAQIVHNRLQRLDLFSLAFNGSLIVECEAPFPVDIQAHILSSETHNKRLSHYYT